MARDLYNANISVKQRDISNCKSQRKSSMLLLRLKERKAVYVPNHILDALLHGLVVQVHRRIGEMFKRSYPTNVLEVLDDTINIC